MKLLQSRASPLYKKAILAPLRRGFLLPGYSEKRYVLSILELAFPTVVCKLSLTEIKYIFEEDATMLQISVIVKKTKEMFDLFNEHFYDNELNRPAITASPDGGRGTYSWCSINEIWNASGEKYREINLYVEYLDWPIFELAATLLQQRLLSQYEIQDHC